jgi:ADP-heptose:LPS heptosyltransferase
MKRQIFRIVTEGGIGDVILHTPVFRAWKQQHPTGRLIVYCMRAVEREALRGNPYIDSLRAFGWRHRMLQTFPRLRRLARREFAACKYGQCAPGLFEPMHASRVMGGMLGVTVEDTTPEVYLTPAELNAGRRGVASVRMPVALHTVGISTPNKLWSNEKWAALVAACPQLDFIQLGVEHEPAIPGARDMRGLSLRDSFAVTRYCRAFVGVDSAPGHAAVALGVPAVILFGPTNPEVWGHPTATNLYVRRRCSPCFNLLLSGQCPYDRACMEAISVADVKNALLRLVDSRTAAPQPANVLQ